MSRVSILIPKNVCTTCIKAKVAKRITRPVKALVILDLESSSFCLSPPDAIQLIAPWISIAKNIKDPIINASPIAEGNTLAKF